MRLNLNTSDFCRFFIFYFPPPTNSALTTPTACDLSGDMDKLAEIIAYKQTEVAPVIARAEKLRAAAAMRNTFHSLEASLNNGPDSLGLIAEIKKASPSAGDIKVDIDPLEQAALYTSAGVSGISVLTDEKFFKGRLEYLAKIRQQCSTPLLRKDFIIHEAQIFEASVAGADAILLIVAALSQDDLVRLLDVAATYQLEALVEVHDEYEMERALTTDATLIGINNRNLKTFEIDLHTTERLAPMVDDDRLLISESGIRSREDAARMLEWGADAILVGESLMRTDHLPDLVKALMHPLA